MIDLVLDGLATYRLTKLVVDDELTREIREGVIERAYTAAGRREQQMAGWVGSDDPGSVPGVWTEVVNNDPDPPKIATLVTCPWCAGMWVALGVVAARRVAPRVWAPFAKALAMSATTGLLSIADG